jgi:hypothetical protein
MVNWGAVTPVIVAIIGVSGVIIPVISTPLVNQIYNKPDLKIDIPSELENGKQIITLTNSGTMPASNLSLILTANNKIINNITNVFSTVNVTLATPKSHSLLEINSPTQINSRLVELHLKNFVNDGGSLVKLAVGAKDTTTQDYVAYATYDQGSKKSIGGVNYTFILDIGYGLWGYSALAMFIVFIYLIMLIRKYEKRDFFMDITQDIIDVRKGTQTKPFR